MAIDRLDAIAGNGIIQSQLDGQTEVFSDLSGVTITAASGDIDFKDVNLSGNIYLSQSGHAGLQNVNGGNTIVGLLNQVAKFYVSDTDTVAAYFTDKVSGANGVSITVQNVSGNEVALVQVDASGIEHNALGGLQGGVSDEYYHLTAQQLIDLTSGVNADNQHFHAASAITVEDTFSYVSGANVQEVLENIDILLADFTHLVTIDIAGAVRNGNTSLGIANDVGYIEFSHDKEGIAAYNVRMPDSYKQTDITLTIKWYSVAANANNVRWTCTYKGLSATDLTTVAGTVVGQTVAEPGAANTVVETSFLMTVHPAAGSLLSFVIRRLGNDAADTSNKNSRLIEASLNY